LAGERAVIQTSDFPGYGGYDQGDTFHTVDHLSDYAVMEAAVRELLIDKRLITASEIRRQIKVIDSRTPGLGARVVARARFYDSYRQPLLANGRNASEELGLTFDGDILLIEPWEKSCHALADVVEFNEIISTEEKRRGVEALGVELIGKLSDYERWIIAFANILLEKGLITPTELAQKTDHIEVRWTSRKDDVRLHALKS
jgi:hypothetical protein